MCKANCGCSIIIAIATILGIIIGILYFIGAIATVGIALGVILAFSALALVLITIIAVFARAGSMRCVCKYGTCTVIGSAISIILTIIALSIGLATGSIGIAILIGAISAAFIVTLVSVVLLLLCLVRSSCRCNIECRD